MADNNPYLSLVPDSGAALAPAKPDVLAPTDSAAPSNPYDAIIDSGSKSTPFRLSVAQVADKAPDAEARVQALGRQYGVPADTVRLQQPDYERRATIDGIDYDKLVADAPATAGLLAQPMTAAISRDDTESLGTIERAVRFLAGSGSAIASAVPAVTSGFYGLAQAGAEGLAGLTAPAGRGSLSEGPLSLAARLLPENPFSRVAEGVAQWRREQDALAKSMVPKNEGPLASGFYSGLQSAGMTGAALLTGQPGAALGALAGVQGGQSYGQARDKGIAPAQAAAFGASQGAIEYATEKIPVSRFLSDFKAGTPFLSMVARQMAAEIPGEQVATALQDLNEWAVLNPEKPFTSYLADRPGAAAQTLVATIVSVGALSGAARGVQAVSDRFGERSAQAQQAGANAAALTETDQAAAASKLRPRNAGTFNDFVRQATEDGPVQDVYIDVQALAQSGVDVRALAAVSPAVASQIDEATATGGSIRIPLDEYTTNVAGTDLSQALVPYLKTDPLGMNQKEAEEFMQSGADQFQQEVERTLSAQEPANAFKQSRDAVQAQVAGELNTVNRFTPAVNNAYATLTANFYAVQAARLGITPQEMAARYPLTIRAQDVSDTADRLQDGAVPFNALAVERRNQAVVHKALADGDPSHPENSADVSVREPQSQEGQSAIGRPPLFAVLSKVRSAALKDPKILDAVIGAVPIDVVNRLFGSEGAAKVALHDEAMFKDGSAIDADLAISQAIDASSPVALLVGEAANAAAELSGVPLGAGLEAQKSTAAPFANKGDSLSQGGAPKNPRASYGVNDRSITLYREADLSSFLHESGHFYLEVMSDIAARADAPQEVKDDMQAVLDWFGVPDVATWRGMPLDQQRENHEKFARGFEAYLFEGKAPSEELRGVFQRFRAWMVNVYRSLLNLNVEITDEVRSVFDRMLATSDAIANQQAIEGAAPLFDSAQAGGMDETQWRAYQNLSNDAQQDALQNLETRSLRDMKWLNNARSRVLKDLQKQADATRAQVRDEVAAEVYATPLYSAMQFLRRGITTVGGETVTAEGNPKLDIDALGEMYGGEGDKFALLDWSKLGYGQYGMLGKDGIAPDEAAQMLGYTSGDQMVRALLDAEPVDSVIDGMTEARMLEQYGDLTDARSMARAADAAIHNDARARFVATELNALQQAVGQRKILASAARQFADAMVARLRVRDVKPGQYTSAEGRAARASEKAFKAGDIQTAALEKRNQLVNTYAAKAAYAAQDEIARGVEYLKKFNKEATRKSIDPSYIDQVDSLLERFDLRTGQSLRDIDRRKSLAEWVQSQEEQGLTPIIDDALLNEARRQSYKDMTVEELRGLVDAVKNIEHLGRLKKKLLTAKDQRDFREAADAIADSIVEHGGAVVPEQRSSDRGLLVAPARLFRQFKAMHRKFASFAREFDGWQDAGPAWDYLVRNMNTAGDNEAVANEQATIKLTGMFDDLLKDGKLSRKAYIPEINQSLTREQTLGVAMNMGNAVNRERVMTGEGWSQSQLDAVLDKLTERDWRFVQGAWDYIDSFKTQIAAKERRLTGVEPQWVEAEPVPTKYGELKGGYFPIAYDPNLSTRSEADIAAQVQRQMQQGLYTRAQTRRGHLKARTESTGRRLRYDLNVLGEHVQQVIHDLSWHEYLVDANRLMRDGAVDEAIRQHYGPEPAREMREALKDIAIGNQAAQNALDRIFNKLRTGATVAGLGWRLTTSLMQPLGLTQSAVRIGPKWVLKGASHWAAGALGLEKGMTDMYEMSPFMRLRGKTMQREINEIQNKVTGEPIWKQKLTASYFLLIQKAQAIADVPTWWGAYEKAMAQQDMTEDKAIALADQAVRDAQGHGQIGDLASIQRGGTGLKLFTSFYSFFNTTYNLTAEAVGRTDFRKPKDVGLLAVDLALLYMLPSILGTLLKAGLKGDDDEEKLLRSLISDQLNYLLGTMVGLRELGAAGQAVTGSGGGDYTGPASVRVFADVAKLGKQIQQGEPDAAFFKALGSVAGVLFHLPAGQVMATADGVVALADGRTQNPGALLVGAPPK